MGLPRQAAVFILAFGLGPAFAGAARGDDEMSRELKALEQYGAANVNACEGWTDGCSICVRRGDGTLGCSRLGVDCHVTDIQCTQRARDPKTGKTPPPE